MNVLLVSRELSPFFGGGIGTYTAEVARALASRGHETHILTMPHEGLARRGPDLFPGITIHTTDIETGRAAMEAYPVYALRYSMAVLDALLGITRRHRFDLIEFPDYHAEGYFALRAKRTLGHFDGATLAVRLHTPTWLCREADDDARIDTELAYTVHMEQAQLRECDLIISPAQKVLDRVRAGVSRAAALGRPGPGPVWAGADASHTPRTAIVRFPITLEALTASLGGNSPAPAPAAPAAGPTVLFFGKLQQVKGVTDLLAGAQLALSRGVDARFRFIGNDSPTGPFGKSMLEHLQRKTQPRWKDRITFEPGIPRDQLGPAIRRATICIFPSHWEAFPMVCLEAMALGGPVIASDAGGLSEIVEHEKNGLLYPTGDTGALASAIERLLSDAPLRAQLAANAPARVRELCNPDAVIAGLQSAIPNPQPAITPSPPHLSASTPRVSILIPHYNLGPFLPATVASARAQTFKDIEILVIDDGSTDPASLAAVDALPRDVRVIRQENRGLGATRNRGLREARADYIIPLDADDLIDPTLVEKLLGALARDPGLTYISPLISYFIDNPGDSTGGWLPLGPDTDLLPVLNIGGAASGTLIHRAHALDAGGWDERMTAYEDWDFWCRLAERRRRGQVIPEYLLKYRVRPGSMFRAELSRHLHLHSYILRQHPSLVTDRAMRLLAARNYATDPRDEAKRLIDENIRYRLADKVNNALKRTGLQKAIKAVIARTPRP